MFSDVFDQKGQDDNLREVKIIVHKFRTIVKFIKNSTKCKEKLDTLQMIIDSIEDINGNLAQQSNKDGTVTKTVLLDVWTRWNSTFTMLRRLVDMQSELVTFLLWYHNPMTQQKEFRGNRTKLPGVSEREWAVVTGLCYVLQPFSVATEELGT